MRDAIAFWVCGAVLIGVFWAFCQWVPEYLAAQWRLSRSEQPMSARLAAARKAFRSVFGNGPPALTRRGALFIIVGAALIVLDFLIVGPTDFGLAAQVFLLSQLALADVCQKHDVLPDALTLPLAALGLSLGAGGILLTPAAVIWGLLIGGGVPLIGSAFFRLSNGRDGMGEGVIKHATAVGAWVGPIGSVVVLALSALYGGIVVPFFDRARGTRPINYGPIYAACAAVVFLFQQIPPETLTWEFLRKMREVL